MGEYFFIDFSIENRTNIRFDIDEIRVKLADKETDPKRLMRKSSNWSRNWCWRRARRSGTGYRNVVVVRKMTFPNDKVLTIEMTGETNQRACYQPEYRL
ncbi:DUF4138 domain-containing protein [Parabacteroides johnsonii]|uniref:DUF4138 domain-containing protein n=1 Tax=Parabacteroides johnsonii TaxID=387661 RepID=UPI00241EDD45|nr:DUF4138 domain-containing protein [Parabacteroides johnsonii]